MDGDADEEDAKFHIFILVGLNTMPASAVTLLSETLDQLFHIWVQAYFPLCSFISNETAYSYSILKAAS